MHCLVPIKSILTYTACTLSMDCEQGSKLVIQSCLAANLSQLTLLMAVGRTHCWKLMLEFLTFLYLGWFNSSAVVSGTSSLPFMASCRPLHKLALDHQVCPRLHRLLAACFAAEPLQERLVDGFGTRCSFRSPKIRNLVVRHYSNRSTSQIDETPRPIYHLLLAV